MMKVAFRCDGGARVGAGHVARCVQLARAFETAGAEVVFCGDYDGVAERLVAAEGFAVAAPGDGPAGLPDGIDAAIVDSYEIAADEIESAAARLPVAAIEDGTAAPAATAVLAYHPDAAQRTEVPSGAIPVLGPQYAPVRPEYAAARRHRELARALVTAGGGEAGGHLIDAAVSELLRLHGIRLISVASAAGSDSDDPRVERRPAGPEEMLDLIAAADVAVSAAGFTPYELACAGVPAVIVPVADNQVHVARAFDAAGIAVGVQDEGDGLAAAVARMADAGTRARLAAAGPAMVDGYGAFRARDALLAAFAGSPPPPPLAYRPATAADSELLLSWRNDPEVRVVSRTREAVTGEEHERWLAGTLADPDRTLLIVERDGEPAGTVRFDRTAERAEISVTIAPGQRGGGLGTRAIREASELELAARPGLREVAADVEQGNDRSLHAFKRAGYRRLPESRRAGSLMLALDRGGLRGLVH